MTTSSFLMVTCQVGAEPALKGELARRWPELRFSYSRPGFLTFKLPPEYGLADDFDLESVFARAYAFSLGKATGETDDERAASVWQLAEGRPFNALHVWPRDAFAPGVRKFEPGMTPESLNVERLARAAAPEEVGSALRAKPQAEMGDLVLDCVVVGTNEWWIGFHRARSLASQWPGGMLDLKLPADAVSRAWLKMEEGLRWADLPLARGDQAAELGCAPGGSCQALLARGLRVMGVDPAEVEPLVLSHPRFTHVRKRGSDMKRREFREVKWLFADMNVAPAYTLDTVEAIATHEAVHIQGLVLTLKLLEWTLAADVPDYLARIRSWGFPQVQARQLQHNRQEICVVARR